MQFILTGFCEQSINNSNYIVSYNSTPSYTQSTATLRCIKGYAAVEPGLAVCDSDGQWIIEYPECEGTYIDPSVCCYLYLLLLIYDFVLLNMIFLLTKPCLY